MRNCCRCKNPLTDENAGRRKTGPRAGKFQDYCRSCSQFRALKWVENNPGYREKNLDRNKKYERKSQLKKKYGLTVESFNAQLLSQGGRCAICRQNFKSDKYRHVDHDHTTGRVRGILCQRCNMAIGLLDDSPDRLIAAAAYLKKTS